MRRSATWLAALVLASGTLAACGGSETVNPRTATPLEDARLGGSTPGSLLEAVTIPDLDPAVAKAGIRAARMTYRSTNYDSGKQTVVSGTVFVPDRDAPDEGWQVVALGHGSTGITENCAPSSSPTLFDQTELVIRLVKLGLVVTMADYEGLGEPGKHPYLDARTAGLNVIDSVRAARKAIPDVGEAWAAIGGSQGGGAVWAADEAASSYAPELDLVGVIALAPAADLSGLVDKAVSGTLTEDQRSAFLWALASLGRLHPDLDLDDYRRGNAAEHWDELAGCSLGPEQRARLPIGPDDLRPRSRAAAEIVRKLLAAWALPSGALSAPLFVAYGEKDTYIDPSWTTAALAKACTLGGTIQANLDPEGDHEAMNAGDPVAWIADRFAGKPATDDCPDA